MIGSQYSRLAGGGIRPSSRRFFAQPAVAAPEYLDENWLPPGTLAAPYALLGVLTGAVTPVSGASYVVGGPGCMVRGGKTVESISFLSSAALATGTHQWFFLAVPDEGASTATVVAKSKNDTSTAWGANVKKTLSLAVADGGSGVWTPDEDTPVYIGMVQVATTPAQIRGFTSVAQVSALMAPMRWFAAGPTGLTNPASMSSTITLTDTTLVPAACHVSGS